MINAKQKSVHKLLSAVVALILLLGVFIPGAEVSDAETWRISHGDMITYDGSTQQEIFVNGKLAFCLESGKSVPTGSVASQIYKNEKIQKILYYGWDGPAQWSGFTNKSMGYMVTSRALSDAYSGTDHSYMKGMSEFLLFVNSQPTPPTSSVAFDKASANVKWDVKNKLQITDDVMVKGDDGDKLTFTLQSGVTLVKKDGSKLTGEVTLKTGESFHLEAPSSVSGAWSTGNVGKSYKFQPLVFKSSKESVQDIATGRPVQDPSAQTSLSVQWLDFGRIELKKIDEKSQFIDGAKFTLKSTDPATGYDGDGIEYEVKNGRLVIDPVPAGTYTLTETEKPDHHEEVVKVFQVVVNKDETTEQIIVNRLKPTGELIIKKTDQDTGAGIEGVEFTVYAAEDIYDTVTFKKIYEKGDKIKTAKTDENGVCKITSLPMGKMYVQETKEADGYVANDRKYEFEFRQQDYETKVYTHEENIENVQTKTTISKVDATTGEELAGATLQVIDPKTGDVVEEWVSTNEPHIIRGLTYGKEYELKETIAPRTHELSEQTVKFTVGADEKVEMKDEPIKISGQIDKRQTKFNTGEIYQYSIDYRSTSNTWADEYNMIDTIDCAVAGYANVTAIKTPVAFEDHDGKMNVWYKTNKTPEDYKEDAVKYNACSTNPENPWNENNERITDYTGWKIWKADVSTLKSQVLDVSDLKLADGEYITGIAFEHGCVEKGFATRTSQWDRSDLKSTDDTLTAIMQKHSESFDLNTAKGITKADGKINYEPAVFFMKVVNKDAARSLKEFWNSAQINIYRNLDQHPDLEDHDNDKVVQKYIIGHIEITDKDKLGTGAETGDIMHFLLPVVAALFTMSAAAALITLRRKKQ